LRALVTGAAGYIGSRLVERLNKSGDEVVALVRPGSSVSKLGNFNGRIIQADLNKKQDVADLREILRGIDCIYHLAAGTSGSHYEMFMNTVVATDNLLDCLQHCDVRRLVLVSSFSVYEMTCLSAAETLDETCPLERNVRLRDSYTICKVRQEKLVREKCLELRIPLVVIRPGKVYGPSDNPVFPQLGLRIPGMCFLVIGGNNILPLTHVSNCVDAIYLAGTVPGIENGVFNIVDDDLPTQREYLRCYERILPPIPRKVVVPFALFKLIARFFESASVWTKGNIPPIISSYRAHNMWKNLRYDNSRAKSALGWKPRVSTGEGIREMLMSLVEPLRNRQFSRNSPCTTCHLE